MCLHASLANVQWVLCCWVLRLRVHVLQALLRETSKNPLSDADLLRTTEVSLAALTRSYGFYHPVSTQLCTRLGSCTQNMTALVHAVLAATDSGSTPMSCQGSPSCSHHSPRLGARLPLQVRHQQDNTVLQWQNRPLTNTLITCAAADVAYLIPVMESQVTGCCT